MYFVYIIDTEKRAYYRMWNFVNESLSLSVGFKDNKRILPPEGPTLVPKHAEVTFLIFFYN